jgi:hypothetical protein
MGAQNHNFSSYENNGTQLPKAKGTPWHYLAQMIDTQLNQNTLNCLEGSNVETYQKHFELFRGKQC